LYCFFYYLSLFIILLIYAAKPELVVSYLLSFSILAYVRSSLFFISPIASGYGSSFLPFGGFNVDYFKVANNISWKGI